MRQRLTFALTYTDNSFEENLVLGVYILELLTATVSIRLLVILLYAEIVGPRVCGVLLDQSQLVVMDLSASKVSVEITLVTRTRKVVSGSSKYLFIGNAASM